MIKISEEIASLLQEDNKVGWFFELHGAGIPDGAEFVIYTNSSNEDFLCHISEIEQEGLLVRLKGQ